MRNIRQHGWTVIVPISSGREYALRACLESIAPDAFADVSQLHFLSLFILPPLADGKGDGALVLETNFDGDEDMLVDVLWGRHGAKFTDIFSHCASEPLANRDDLGRVIKSHHKGEGTYFVALPGMSVKRILDNHAAMEACRAAVKQSPPGDLEALAAQVKSTKPLPEQFRSPWQVRYGEKILAAFKWLALACFGLLTVGASGVLQLDAPPLHVVVYETLTWSAFAYAAVKILAHEGKHCERFVPAVLATTICIAGLLTGMLNLQTLFFGLLVGIALALLVGWVLKLQVASDHEETLVRRVAWVVVANLCVTFLLAGIANGTVLGSVLRAGLMVVLLTGLAGVAYWTLAGEQFSQLAKIALVASVAGIAALSYPQSDAMVNNVRLGFALLVVVAAGLIHLATVIRARERSDDASIATGWRSRYRNAILAQETHPGKVHNHLASVTTVKCGRLRLWLLRAVLWFSRLPIYFGNDRGELSGIATIHFARWVIIDGGKRLLFMSNYAGAWDSYLDEFIDNASVGLTAIWGNTCDFPCTRWLVGGGSRDEPVFKCFARESQVTTLYFYCAYPSLTVDEIERNRAFFNIVNQGNLDSAGKHDLARIV